MNGVTPRNRKKLFIDNKLATSELPKKNSQRALYIRRQLEYLQEMKRIDVTFGDDYWNF